MAGEKKQVIERLAHCTILLPPSLGGLANGMFDGKAGQAADVADRWLGEGQTPRRRRLFFDQIQPIVGPTDMSLVRTIDTRPDADEFARPADEPQDATPTEGDETRMTDKGRFWNWYVRPADAEDATAASLRPVTWQDHTNDVVARAKQIVDALGLRDDLTQAIILAAEFHDLGKQRELWQRSIGNPTPADWYAKPGKPGKGPHWRPWRITEYRHEFGSLLDALDAEQPHRARLDDLPQPMRDLVLHLVAAHHGYARPHFPPHRVIDPNRPQSEADAAAAEVMRRFARLQRRYGRWGLAYLESLLRAADWAASAEPAPIHASTA